MGSFTMADIKIESKESAVAEEKGCGCGNSEGGCCGGGGKEGCC